MYLDDPLSFPQPFKPKAQEYDFRTEFWNEAPDMRPQEGRSNPGTVKVCRYTDGRHETPPRPWCPHFSREDETGKRVRPEWTAQDG